MSETKDYLEQHPELEKLTPEELEKHLEEDGAKAEMAWEAERDSMDYQKFKEAEQEL